MCVFDVQTKNKASLQGKKKKIIKNEEPQLAESDNCVTCAKYQQALSPKERERQ